MTNLDPRWWWLAALVALLVWVVTAFVMTLETGWVHVFLVAGVLAVVRAIVEQEKGGHEEADMKRRT